LNGWSDADVLTHAIIDSLLGAAALGDMGSNFPSSDGQYKDISSLILLEKTKSKLIENGWRIINIDTTVVTEEPRLESFINPIRKRLSQALNIKIDCMSVKASTANRLGFIGQKKGVEVYAVALIETL